MTERDDTLEEIACYIDDSKDAAQRIGKLPLVAALEVMAQEVRSRKGKSTQSESAPPLQDVATRLIAALQERKDNCEKSARSYNADGQVTYAVQCRSAAGAVQECIDAVGNILRSEWQWFGSADDNGKRS